MPILNGLIMLLHILRNIRSHVPLLVHIRRLLARREGRMGLVRRARVDVVRLGLFGVAGRFCGGCGVGGFVAGFVFWVGFFA